MFFNIRYSLVQLTLCQIIPLKNEPYDLLCLFVNNSSFQLSLKMFGSRAVNTYFPIIVCNIHIDIFCQRSMQSLKMKLIEQS